MGEVTLVRLTKDGDFNGSSAISLTRDNFSPATQQNPPARVYTAAVTGAAGVVPADIWGFFRADSAKLVGVSQSSLNPKGQAQVIDLAGRPRRQINLRRDPQYVLMYPGDKLGVRTNDSTVAAAVSVEIQLAVNEATERDHMQWALAHEPTYEHVHYRIKRNQGGFAPNFGTTWQPSFLWNESACIFETVDNTSGAIPLSHLSPWGRDVAVYVRVRYAGSVNPSGKLYVVELETRKFLDVHPSPIPDMRWSRVAYASHQDLIALECTDPPAGGDIVCDIELERVLPQGAGFRDRYNYPGVFPYSLGDFEQNL